MPSSRSAIELVSLVQPQSKHHPSVYCRRSIRLQGYDYSQAGAYFITICTHGREPIFGEIANGEMVLNDYGMIVHDNWGKTPGIRAEIELGEYVIMPNHFHGIIIIHEPVGAYGHTPLQDNPIILVNHTPLPNHTPLQLNKSAALHSPSKTVGSVVRGFKAAVTTRINQQRGTPGAPVWQRNYWEHIIRDDQDHANANAYILNNPAQWETDQLYPRE